MMADDMPSGSAVPGGSLWISVSHEDENLVRQACDAPAKDAGVLMPPAHTCIRYDALHTLPAKKPAGRFIRVGQFRVY